MSRIFWNTAGALALGLTATLSAGASSGFFYDDFERPNSSTIGPDWVEQKGTWELVDGSVRGFLSGDYAQAVYTGLETGEQPYVAQIDATTTASGRWFGVMFNVNPDNPTNFYALVMRGAGTSASAAQFRVYVDGVLTVRNDVTGIFDPDTLARHSYFRYRVISREPGVFDLTILRLDQETREPVEIIWEQRVEDDTHAFWGGHGGVYGNSDFRVDDFLLAHHDEVRAVDAVSLDPAVEIEFLAERDRFYQAQLFDNGEWGDHGPVILGRGEVTSLRLPVSDPEQVRIVTSLE